MITLTKKFEFEAAHRLSNYQGACKEIHGHTYKLAVTISGQIDEESDMILDFKVLKNHVKKAILDHVDHALILKDAKENRQIFQNYTGNIFWMTTEPTAERMLLWMVVQLTTILPPYIRLESLQLYETSSSFASWKNSIG